MTIQETLRDPLWQFVGAVIGILALFTSLLVARLQRPRKRIAYYVTSIPFLTVEEQMRKHVEVLYKGEPVRDVHLQDVWMSNAGNSPVFPHEMIAPISLRFGDNSTILAADVVERSPSNLDVSIQLEKGVDSGSMALIAPLLLNPGDFFKIRFLVSGVGEVAVLARVAGVSRLEVRDPEGFLTLKTATKIAYLLLGVAVVVIFLFFGVPFMANVEIPTEVTCALLLVFTGFAVAFLWALLWALPRLFELGLFMAASFIKSIFRRGA